MNRREFIQYSVVAGAVAGTAAFGQDAEVPADTQPANTDAAADRMKLVTYCGLCDWHVRLP